MNGLNGIIYNGKVYESIKKDSYDCSDCALRERCGANGRYAPACVAFGYDHPIFRYSQELTDKLNL